ncbi:MAG: hypothetical protein AB7G93_13975 [Bdellovibrionales bacterium]
MWKVIAYVLIASSSPAEAADKSTKEIATEAIVAIFFKRNPAAVDRYVAQDYIQHQPGLARTRNFMLAMIDSSGFSVTCLNYKHSKKISFLSIRWCGLGPKKRLTPQLLS